MQNIKFKCAYCAQSLNAPVKIAGCVRPCPVCKKQIKVPNNKQDENSATHGNEVTKTRFRCLSCSQLIIAPIKMMGQSLSCPSCKTQIIIESDKEQYISDCLRQHYIELHETRQWNTVFQYFRELSTH